MSFFATANPTVESTALGVTSNPSTATLLAEIDSTQMPVIRGGQRMGVTWIVGVQSTLCTFLLEQALSTGLDMSTAGRSQTVVEVSSGQSAQFFTKHTVEQGDRFRVRVNSSFTGGANAKIIAEYLD